MRVRSKKWAAILSALQAVLCLYFLWRGAGYDAYLAAILAWGCGGNITIACGDIATDFTLDDR